VIVRKNGQITLPQEVRQALGIDRGSVLELRVEEGRIVLEVIAR
jgi:AbrB family looped-hinge helix DNA binding protein